MAVLSITNLTFDQSIIHHIAFGENEIFHLFANTNRSKY